MMIHADPAEPVAPEAPAETPAGAEWAPDAETPPAEAEAPVDPAQTEDAIEYRTRGIKPSLSRPIHDFIVEQIKAGSYREPAAKAAGICHSTFRNWVCRGHREIDRLKNHPNTKPLEREQRYLDLVLDIQRAEADAELDCVTIVRNAAVSNWSAAAWLLERKLPERFSMNRTLKLQIEEEQEAFLAKLERRLPAEVFDAVLLAATEPEREGEIGSEGTGPGARRKKGSRASGRPRRKGGDGKARRGQGRQGASVGGQGAAPREEPVSGG
jgi:hypothetical protein